MQRELIVLIPGLGRYARFEQKKAFVDGLDLGAESKKMSRVESEDVPANVIRMEWEHAGVVRQVDFVEAYWNDLVPSLYQEGVRTRFIRGLSLLAYWMAPGVWRGFFERKYLTLSLFASGVVLITWYIGIVMLFAQGLAADPELFEGFGVYAGPIIRGLELLGTWKVWLAVTAVMGFLPVALMIDIMDFAKRYTSDEQNPGEDRSLRLVVLRRVRDQVLAALRHAPYDRLTIVGHSFGAVVAVDVVADLPVPEDMPFRLVTLGSPFKLLERKASWLTEERAQCLARRRLQRWIDVDSKVDFLSTGSGVEHHRDAHVVMLPSFGTVIDKLQARNHARYFDNPLVGRLVLDG